MTKGAVRRIADATLVARAHAILAGGARPLVIFGVALAARSAWVAYAPSDPFDGRLSLGDAVFYHSSAASLAQGHGYVMPSTPLGMRGWNTAFWPPGYPFVLASLYRLVGPHVSMAWGANIVLGTLTCVILYFVGRTAFSERAGFAAGLLLAVFPGHVFFSSLILSEVTFTFFITLAMLLILAVNRADDKGRPLRVVLLGLVVGFAALTRGQGLFLIPVALVFWLSQTGDWARALPWATATMLTAAVVILPWTVRNYVQMGSLVVISTNDGVNLYMGHNELATGRMMYNPGSWADRVYADLPPSRREVATSNLLLREGLKYMFTHPGRELQLSWAKIRALYADDEEGIRQIPNRQAGKTVRAEGLIGRAANVYFFVTLALSAGGVFIWLRHRRGGLSLPLLVIAVFTIGHLPFFGDPRFHYPMLPSFALLAAAALVSTAEWARQSCGKRCAGADGGCTAGGSS